MTGIVRTIQGYPDRMTGIVRTIRFTCAGASAARVSGSRVGGIMTAFNPGL